MAMLLYDAGQCSQRLIGFPWTREGGGNVGFQDYDGASRGVPGCEPVGRAPLKVILRKNLVGIDSIRGHTFTEWFLHNLSSRSVWPAGR
jgi:hypothetical protein